MCMDTKSKSTKCSENGEIGEIGYKSTKLEYVRYNLATLNFTWNIGTLNLGRMGNVGNVDYVRGTEHGMMSIR